MFEPCKSCEVLTLEVNSLNEKVLELQKESLSFSKYKKSTNDLEELISRQKVSKDKGGLGFFKQGTTTPISLTKPITFVKTKENEAPKIPKADALTRHQRARPLRKIGSPLNDNIKPISPQAPLVITRGNQAPIAKKRKSKTIF
jgi:hypothetical protein